MRTVYLIGNGVDVNIGLPTRYIDFYNYYLGLNQSEDSKVVSNLKNHLKDCLSNDGTYWSDLEEALGKYTTELHSYEELEEAYDDINEEMKKYIYSIEKSDLPEGVNKDLLKTNISSPEIFLTLAEQEIIRTVYNNVGRDTHYISIINFNYTTTIEKALTFIDKPIKLGPATYHKDYNTSLNTIIHIHGDVEQPILGINDSNQIHNEKLKSNVDVQDYLIKPRINNALGHLIDRQAKQLIKDANLICIYGLSLGDTDGLWWKLVGEKLLGGHIVILFVYDKELHSILPRKLSKYKRSWKIRLCDAAKIQNGQRESVMDRIIVAPNTAIFNIS